MESERVGRIADRVTEALLAGDDDEDIGDRIDALFNHLVFSLAMLCPSCRSRLMQAIIQQLPTEVAASVAEAGTETLPPCPHPSLQ